MKDPIEVLRRKEAELQQLREEVEALRMADKILSERKTEGKTPDTCGKILQMPANLA